MSAGIRLRVLPSLLPKEIELQNDGTTIQWRYVDEDDDAWRDLVDVSDLVGPPGDDGLMTSVVAGSGIAVDSSDPANPVVAVEANLQAYNAVTPTAAGLGLLDDTTAYDQRVSLDVAKSYTTKSGDYTVLAADNLTFIDVDATAAARTMSLPSVDDVDDDFEATFGKSDSSVNHVILEADGAELIEGVGTFDLVLQGQTATIRKAGTGWRVTIETGTVLEGTYASGSFRKHADGRIEFWNESVTLTRASSTAATLTWSAPVTLTAAAHGVIALINSVTGDIDIDEISCTTFAGGTTTQTLRCHKVAAATNWASGTILAQVHAWGYWL